MAEDEWDTVTIKFKATADAEVIKAADIAAAAAQTEE